MFELTPDEWALYPTFTVTFHQLPDGQWVPDIPADMPDSLAARLIIDIHDLTPSEIARGQAVVQAFFDRELDEIRGRGVTTWYPTLDEAQADTKSATTLSCSIFDEDT